jgi:uncharacterized protein YhaN
VRIDRVRIDGFGRFEHLDLALGSGLNVLHGPNEAGKSTLLAFVRAVLFGFERKSSPARYEPVGGSSIGGELHLLTRQGPMIVRRTGSPRRYDGQLALRGPAGELLEEARLADALGGIGRDLYYQVFAFGLDELSSFEALAEQGSVSEALFAAGMQGAQRLPYAGKVLREGADALFTPRGQKPELSLLLKDLDSTQAALRTLGDRPAEHSQRVRRLEEVEAELVSFEERAAAASARRDELRRLASALEDLSRLDRVEAELASLPALDGFPEQGAARLEELLERQAQARAEVDERLAEQAALEEVLEVLGAEPPVASRQAEVRAALNGFTARAQARRALPAKWAALDERQRQAAEQLRGLGLSLDAGGLLALELSEREKGELLAFRDGLREARARIASAEERVRVVAGERDRLTEDQHRIGAERDRLSGGQAADLRRRQAALSRIEPARSELRRVSDGLRERASQEEARRAQTAPAPREVFPAWLGAAASVALLALAGASAWALDRRAAPWALGAAALLVLLLGLLQRRAAGSFRESAAAHRQREGWRAAELQRLTAERHALSREQAGARQVLATAEVEAGVAPGADAGALALHGQELAETLREIEIRERLSTELDALAARASRAVAAHQRLSAELAGVRDEAAALEAELARRPWRPSWPDG